jgi:hypothetical protein
MKLSTEDASLFFELMWSLQVYVNRKLKILPDVTTLEAYSHLASSKKIAVRDALYDNIELIDTYIKDNPQNLSAEELAIVKGWKNFKRGNFFIERLLKKYAVFVGDDNVYGVLALHDAFDEILPYGAIPYYAKAVLLPFKGRIIYDGLLQGYSVFFGGGVKADLRETYMAAKQNGRIIESLDSQKQAQKLAQKRASKKKAGKEWGPILAEIAGQAKSLRSSSSAPAIHSPAFSLAKASIEFARLAVEDPDNLDELWQALRKVERAINKSETVLYRADYRP